MNEIVNIIGQRIIVRDWRDDELEGMHRWWSDPQVKAFLSFGTSTLAESENHLQDLLASQGTHSREHYYLAIESRALGITMGEIGYFLEPRYWRKGFATEAAKMMASYAFSLSVKKGPR